MSNVEPTPPGGQPAGSPRIKRRWAILGRAGGGVAVIAVAGALAAGAPDTGAGGDAPAGADSPELIADG